MAGYTYTPGNLAANFAALEKLWTDSGGATALAPQMAAVAIAESGGDPTGVCYDYVDASGVTRCSSTPVANGTGQVDVGLWSIANLHLPAGTDPSVLTDPATNAKYAVALAGQDGTGIPSAWAAEFVAGSDAAKRYASALAESGASLTNTVHFVVGDQTPGSVASTVYGQKTTGNTGSGIVAPPAAAAAATTTPAVFWAPVVALANNIALEAFAGAAAIALLSGGILWLASSSPTVQTAAKVAAA